MAALAALSAACSVDPIGALFRSETGPFTERDGPFTRITFNPGPDRDPAWSSDGTRIAYSAAGFEPETQGQSTIQSIPAGGGISVRVSPLFSRIDENRFPAWFDDDRRIAYISFRGVDFGSPPAPTVTIVDPANPHAFTETARDLDRPLGFAVSPDGAWIAWSDFVPALSDSSLALAPPAGRSEDTHSGSPGGTTLIWTAALPVNEGSSRLEGTFGAGRVTWSPDSRTIAYGARGGTWTIPREGGFPRFFVEGDSPAWSPDGARVAVVIDGDIYIHDLGDGGRTRVTTEGGEDPAWSPDGTRLAFARPHDDDFDIYVVRLADLAPSGGSREVVGGTARGGAIPPRPSRGPRARPDS